MPIQFDNSNTGTITLGSSATSDFSLVFPAADGTNAQGFVNDGSGNLSFATPGTALVGWTSALNTAAPNATINVSSLTASGGTTNQSIAIVPTNFGRFYLPNNGLLGGQNPGTGIKNWDFAGYSMRQSNYSTRGSYSVSAGYSANSDSACAYTVGVGGVFNFFNSGAQYGVSINGINLPRTGSYGLHVNGDLSDNSAQYSCIFNSKGTGDCGTWHTYNFGTWGGTGYSINVGFGSGIHGCVLGQTTDATPQILGTQGNVALASVDNTTCWRAIVNTTSVTTYFVYIMCYDYVNGDKAKMWQAEGAFGTGGTGVMTNIGTPTVTNLFGDSSLSSASVTVTLYDPGGGFAVYYVTGTGVAGTNLRWIAWTTQTNSGGE